MQRDHRERGGEGEDGAQKEVEAALCVGQRALGSSRLKKLLLEKGGQL